MGNDVVEAVAEFFKRGHLLKACNATFLLLIPKLSTTKELKEYKPISLCKVLYKIITKILVERMKQYCNIPNNEN